MKAIEILLVEDSPTDRLLALDALERSGVINTVNVVENGEDAIRYLRREDKFSGANRPDVVLLDLNLPRKDGREVLAEMQADSLLKGIAVIVLTTSQSDEDLARVAEYGARAYMTKPVRFEQFAHTLHEIGGYWFEVVTRSAVNTLQQPNTTPLPRVTAAGPSSEVVHVVLVAQHTSEVLHLQQVFSSTRGVHFDLRHVLDVSELSECLRTKPADLVVLDLDLPAARSLEQYRFTKNLAGGLPVLLICSEDDEELCSQALNEGAVDCLLKNQLTARVLQRIGRQALDSKAQQQQLRQSQKLEAVGRLAIGVAHDFNNILTVVKANAEMVTNTTQLASIYEWANEILEAADHAGTLTRQLLTFSRPRAAARHALDVNQIVGDFAKMLRRLLGENIALELQLSAQLEPVLGDAGSIEQLLLNLAVNARDAMPQGGKLRVQTSSLVLTTANSSAQHESYPGAFVKLTVADTGQGIPPEVLERLFEPFFTTKPTGQGNGLGLATVREIVREHRGWLDVKSSAEAGTVFDVMLPVAARQHTALSSRPPAPPRRERYTVLLVEEEQRLRSLAAKVLVSHGYVCLEASNTAEAVLRWKEHAEAIDVLVTELNVDGEGTGVRLADALKEQRSALPVIYTGGFPHSVQEPAYDVEEGTDFLNKPYAPSQLLSAVRRRIGAIPTQHSEV